MSKSKNKKSKGKSTEKIEEADNEFVPASKVSKPAVKEKEESNGFLPSSRKVSKRKTSSPLNSESEHEEDIHPTKEQLAEGEWNKCNNDEENKKKNSVRAPSFTKESVAYLNSLKDVSTLQTIARELHDLSAKFDSFVLENTKQRNRDLQTMLTNFTQLRTELSQLKATTCSPAYNDGWRKPLWAQIRVLLKTHKDPEDKMILDLIEEKSHLYKPYGLLSSDKKAVTDFFNQISRFVHVYIINKQSKWRKAMRLFMNEKLDAKVKEGADVMSLEDRDTLIMKLSKYQNFPQAVFGKTDPINKDAREWIKQCLGNYVDNGDLVKKGQPEGDEDALDEDDTAVDN